MLIAVVAVAIATIWSRLNVEEPHHFFPRDYAEIFASDTLHVVTEYNSISLFVDGDTVCGFNYEMLQEFAREKGIQLRITPEMSYEKRLEGLAEGKYDLIAYDIPTTSELKDSLLLTHPIVLSRMVLVQRNEETDSSNYIKSQIDLAGRTLHVPKNSPSILRIRNLEKEIADTIIVNEIERYSSEQLIAMVAHKDIDYAVIDESIAKAYIDSFPQLDINTGISMTLFYSWGVNKQSPMLLDSVNDWLSRFMKTKQYKELYKKYYQ